MSNIIELNDKSLEDINGGAVVAYADTMELKQFRMGQSTLVFTIHDYTNVASYLHDNVAVSDADKVAHMKSMGWIS